jgi:epoxide hydrolase-like predicted phosphatase
MRFLVLDIGGVFYRGWPEAEFWPRWSARTGLEFGTLESFLTDAPEARMARLGQISAQAYYDRAAARLSVPAHLLQEAAEAAYLSDFNAPLADFVCLLRAEGVPVSALTNSLSSEGQIKGRRELAGLFDHVISSCDVGIAKPDPEIFRALLERLAADPAEVIFLDDGLSHVEAARRLGIDAIHVAGPAEALSELRRLFGQASDSSRR